MVRWFSIEFANMTRVTRFNEDKTNRGLFLGKKIEPELSVKHYSVIEHEFKIGTSQKTDYFRPGYRRTKARDAD